jgi:hypothetical protein
MVCPAAHPVGQTAHNLMRGNPMSKRYFVFSTLSNDNAYSNYSEAPNGGQPVPVETVTIKGGSNVIGKHFITPHGVMTEVTEAQMDILNSNFLFKQHLKSGHIVVRDTKSDPEKVVAKEMEKVDGSAPVTPESLKALGIAAKPEGKSGRMVS